MMGRRNPLQGAMLVYGEKHSNHRLEGGEYIE